MSHNWPFWFLIAIGTFGLWRRYKTEGKTPLFYVGAAFLSIGLACAAVLSLAR